MTYEPIEKLLRPRFDTLLDERARYMSLGDRRNYWLNTRTINAVSKKNRHDETIKGILTKEVSNMTDCDMRDSSYYQQQCKHPIAY